MANDDKRCEHEEIADGYACGVGIENLVEEVCVRLQEGSNGRRVPGFKDRAWKEGEERQGDEIERKGNGYCAESDRALSKPFHPLTLTHAHRDSLPNESGSLPFRASSFRT